MIKLNLTSNDFEDGGVIPRKNGYKNENSSPSLKISDVPQEAKSLALIMDDPDAMGAVGKVWVHWVLWNIPANTKQIDENTIPSGSIEGKTDFGEVGYGGPAPPDKEHTYIFKLFALDKELGLEKGSTKNQLEDAIKDSIIAESTLKGRYAP